MELPNDVIGDIMSIADMPIDTYLAFKDRFSIKRKKVDVDPQLRANLDALLSRRAKLYRMGRSVLPPSYICIESFSTTLDNGKTLHITIDDVDDETRMTINIWDVDKETQDYWLDKYYFCNFHTGGPCDGWVDVFLG